MPWGHEEGVRLKVLVVGGGGREHSLAIALVASPTVAEVHLCPGNAGTGMIATNHDCSADDVDAVVILAEQLSVDLVVVGPEAPLVNGLADILRQRGIACFGPDADNAMLEGSKLRAKQAMSNNGVPTAEYQILRSDSDIDSALDTYSGNPWVVKRDVLAGGKGVVVTSDRQVAREAIIAAIDSDGEVLLEEFLSGEEASVLVVMDESGYVCLPASQDHKRLGDGDSGPNTGGMGAYAPAPVFTDEVRRKTIDRIVKPMHEDLRNSETPYRGVLYVGLMINSESDPFVVEFNVRFGDPECQITLPLVETDLAQHLLAAAQGRLVEEEVRFLEAHCLTVVLAAEGYPGTVVKGRRITGTGSRSQDGEHRSVSWVNHAGTGIVEGELVSTGGRVLSATGMGPSLSEACEAAYRLINGIELEGSQHRSDIGYRAL
jgi:phosphoribosylamine--glycine ligase